MKEKEQIDRSFVRVFSLLLAVAAIASTTAYFVYRFFSDRAYNEKWKDYDDCGLM
ncbi:MAG TPA: hypothetical protein H9671_01855 [Firmicutes bacterium]|nr:hypothetical protein [Bacillota bacterium]